VIEGVSAGHRSSAQGAPGLLDRGGTAGETLRTRLRTIPQDEVATTIISYEEQTRGWLARIARVQTVDRQVAVYRELKRQLLNYCLIPVLDFDERAAAEFGRLRRARIRIGAMDLKIAAIVLANSATLLSRNLSDFGKVPSLPVEDWSV
jgi:tRNA(fMet)-specific endonuclease VapC